jgi:cytochrome c-type biogenesis protein CcmF
LGIGIFMFGVTCTESWSIHEDLSLKPGQTAQVGEFVFTMTKLEAVAGPNYDAEQSEIVISKAGKQIAVVHPQKRLYRVQRMPLTEAGIANDWTRHLLASMGDSLGDDTWSMRLQYKPMVRFIWLGAYIMALGGFISMLDRRYRQRVRAEETSPAAADAGVA